MVESISKRPTLEEIRSSFAAEMELHIKRYELEHSKEVDELKKHIRDTQLLLNKMVERDSLKPPQTGRDSIATGFYL